MWGRVGVVLCALVLTGCGANHNSIFRTYNVNEKETGDVTVALIDAKQRALISQKTPESEGRTIVCSEPSPDAFTVLSSALSASGSFGTPKLEAAAAFAAKISESGASIGLRTQTITAMRDLLFYLCQYYMAGAVGKANVQAAMQRQGKLLTAIVAIEQLTGAPTPTTVNIKADTGDVIVSPTLPDTVSPDSTEPDTPGESGTASPGKTETSSLGGPETGLLGDTALASSNYTAREQEIHLPTSKKATGHQLGKQESFNGRYSNGFDAARMWLIAEASTEPKEDAAKKPKEDAAKKPKDDAAKKAKEDAAKKPKEDAAKKPKEDAAKKAKDDAAKKAQQDAAKKAKEEAERKAKAEAVAKAVVQVVQMVFDDDEVENLCLVKLLNREDLDEFTKEVCRLRLLNKVTAQAARLGVLDDDTQASIRDLYRKGLESFPRGGDEN